MKSPRSLILAAALGAASAFYAFKGNTAPIAPSVPLETMLVAQNAPQVHPEATTSPYTIAQGKKPSPSPLPKSLEQPPQTPAEEQGLMEYDQEDYQVNSLTPKIIESIMRKVRSTISPKESKEYDQIFVSNEDCDRDPPPKGDYDITGGVMFHGHTRTCAMKELIKKAEEYDIIIFAGMHDPESPNIEEKFLHEAWKKDTWSGKKLIVGYELIPVNANKKLQAVASHYLTNYPDGAILDFLLSLEKTLKFEGGIRRYHDMLDNSFRRTASVVPLYPALFKPDTQGGPLRMLERETIDAHLLAIEAKRHPGSKIVVVYGAAHARFYHDGKKASRRYFPSILQEVFRGYGLPNKIGVVLTVDEDNESTFEYSQYQMAKKGTPEGNAESTKEDIEWNEKCRSLADPSTSPFIAYEDYKGQIHPLWRKK